MSEEISFQYLNLYQNNEEDVYNLISEVKIFKITLSAVCKTHGDEWLESRLKHDYDFSFSMLTIFSSANVNLAVAMENRESFNEDNQRVSRMGTF